MLIRSAEGNGDGAEDKASAPFSSCCYRLSLRETEQQAQYLNLVGSSIVCF